MARRNGSLEELPKVRLTKESVLEGLTIFKYLRPYKTRFLLGLVFIALSAGTTMAFPYLLKLLIDSAQAMSEGQVPVLTPGRIALMMLGVLTFQMFFSFMRIYLLTYVGEYAVADMRRDIYRKLIMMPMDFFAQRRVGELSSRISADVVQIQDTVTVVLAELLRGVLTLLIGMALIQHLSWKLTLVMLSVIPVIIVIAILFSKKIRRYSRETQDQLGVSGTIVQETLQGISNVKSFNNEWFEINRYTRSIHDVVALAIRNGRFRGLFVSFLLFSVFGAIVFVVWYAVAVQQMPFGSLTAFVVFADFVGGTMAGVADMYSQLQKSLGATQRVREILREDSEAIEIVRTDSESGKKLEGAVEIRDLSFSYPSRPGVPVLQDINLIIKPGQQIAIVGPSGAGKSTLVSLLLRFYEPQQGGILFDGVSATEYSLSWLRQQMALVPQDVLLFGGTIRENIAYGRPDATQEAIEEAALQANAHEFIQHFPEGYETLVGERGVKLSGGQRQRLAIARALLKDPVILILDEATSSLDSESESLVQEALYNLMKNRTSIVIAHRLSTIRNADQIVVLDHGKIKEQGTHSELIELPDGMYRSLSKLQFNA